MTARRLQPGQVEDPWEKVVARTESLEDLAHHLHEVLVPDAIETAYLTRIGLEDTAERLAQVARILHACQFLLLVEGARR